MRALLVWAVCLAAVILLDEDLARLVRVGGRTETLMASLGYWLGHGFPVVGSLVLLWLLGRRLNLARLKACAARAILAFAVSGLASQIIKHLIARPRPRLMDPSTWSPGMRLADGLNSFPSGHTTTTMAVASILSFYYPKGTPLFMLWTAFVGSARIAGGAHYPLDVFAGVVLGLLTSWVVIHWTNSISSSTLVQVGKN